MTKFKVMIRYEANGSKLFITLKITLFICISKESFRISFEILMVGYSNYTQLIFNTASALAGLPLRTSIGTPNIQDLN